MSLLDRANKHSQIIFVDRSLVLAWLDSLIGPSELLLVVSHLFAVPILSPETSSPLALRCSQ